MFLRAQLQGAWFLRHILTFTLAHSISDASLRLDVHRDIQKLGLNSMRANEVVPLQSCLPTVRLGIAAQVTDMRSSLKEY